MVIRMFGENGELDHALLKRHLAIPPNVTDGRAERINGLHEYFKTLSLSQLLKVFGYVMPNDFFQSDPVYLQGFNLLLNSLVLRNQLTLNELQGITKTVSLYNVTLNNKGGLEDMRTGGKFNELSSRYSHMKFGDVSALEDFSNQLSDLFIANVDDEKSHLGKMFRNAREKAELVALISAGSRNIELAKDQLEKLFLRKVNLWLGLNSFPILNSIRSYRLTPTGAGYSGFGLKERLRNKREVLPSLEYFSTVSNLIFLDDARITGATADWFEASCKSRGVKNFIPMYLLYLDPKVADANPSIELQINHSAIPEYPGQVLASLMNQGGFRPVQRLVHLILRAENRFYLKDFFCKTNINALFSVYEVAVGNGYYGNSDYKDSLDDLMLYLRSKDVLNSKGLPIRGRR